jgi:hypothetical protein
MDKKVLFVRICFLTGAILDALFVLPLIYPKLAGFIVLGIDNYNPDAMTTYLMNVGAALMAGWAGILFWAAIKPIERRGIIPVTVFPLLSGLMAAGIYFYISNGIQLEKILPLLMISFLLIVAQSIGYFITKNIKNNLLSHQKALNCSMLSDGM